MRFHDETDEPRRSGHREVWDVTTRPSGAELRFVAVDGVVVDCDPRVKNLYVGKPLTAVLERYRRSGATVEQWIIETSRVVVKEKPMPSLWIAYCTLLGGANTKDDKRLAEGCQKLVKAVQEEGDDEIRMLGRIIWQNRQRAWCQPEADVKVKTAVERIGEMCRAKGYVPR